MKLLQDLKIGIKIMTGFMFIAFLSSLMGVYALSNLQDVGAKTLMTVMIVSVISISIFTGIFISSLLTKPLKKFKYILSEIIDGHYSKRTDYKAKDELGEIAGLLDFVAADMEDYVVGTIKQISEGNVDVEILTSDEQDKLAIAFKKTIGAMTGIHSEIKGLTKAITEGELSKRGNADLYSGVWNELVTGINGLIDAFAEPFHVTANYVERISRGDIPSRITDDYMGDFNDLKHSINGCVDTMNGLLSDTNRLIQAAREGELDTRGNAEAYPGDWGVLVKEINDLIDAFVEPINMTAEYVERISRGDIPEKITAAYFGDFNVIKDNLNHCIETMNGLVRETDTLTERILNGELSTRGNAASFAGKWRSLVEGINNLSDAFVSPIEKTIEYFGRISKGDIPDKITEDYHGDFSEIKSSINTCIDMMSGLLRETNTLIQAIQQGQLDVRANTYGFAGGWEKLVGGINRLVDTVAEPVNEVTDVMNIISEGNLSVSVKGDYQGKFGVLSSATNRTAGYLNTVIGEISDLLDEFSKGNLTTDQIEGYKGDFASISDSLNTIFTTMNSVLGEISIAADQVSIGSKQVSDGSQALSQGAAEQASSIEELTASISEVEAKTKENAGGASQADALTTLVKNSAEQGNRHMGDMLKAMEEISHSSGNISKIIKVIDDIAFQTNILALNAAVEAARAGQHGKGFAVVAEEVRSLAARSAEAAKDTTELIQSSIHKSAAGTDIAHRTAEALTEIVEGVTKASDIISGIARSSNDQALGITQINLGLNQVSQVVQSNAATAEESAASSQQLSGQAELLKEMVDKFRLRKRPDLESELKFLDSKNLSDKY